MHEGAQQSGRQRGATSVRHIRAVLADDNPEFLDAIHRFLGAHAPRIRIVGEARTGQEALGLVEVLKPDVLLLDLEMPDMKGLAVLRRSKTVQPTPCVIVVTLHDQDEYRSAAMEAGADGFVSKHAIATELMPLINKLIDGAPTP
jgi:DNA-binding NarL/FixJ family response regulator